MASNPPTPFRPTTRREFFQLSGRGIGLLAFSRFAPSFLVGAARAATPAPEKDRQILVIVQLAGGNDGLNTLVPFNDPNYYRLRPTLAIPRGQALPLNDSFGLHPSCAALHGLFHDGKLAVVQSVGYPNPNHSHFRSTEIWETASSSAEFISTGWIGRYLDNTCAGRPASTRDPLAVHVNALNGEPETFIGAEEHPTFGLQAHGGGRRENRDTLRLLEAAAGTRGPAGSEEEFLQQTLMDALVTEGKVQGILENYRAEAAYPGDPFSASLKNIASLIAAGLPTRVYFVSLNGFDTHVNQAGTHANRLKVLSDGLAAFQRDLEAHRLDGQVLTMTFSEFGRRPSENESRGTDHGTAAPLLVLGPGTKGGLHGAAPSLALPRNQDLIFSTDFRGVYATMLEDWLSCPSEPVLLGRFPKLPILA